MATLVPARGEAALVTSIIEKGHVERQSWIEDRRFYWDFDVRPDYTHAQPPIDSIVLLLTDAIRDRALDRGRIGIEDATLPIGHLDRLRAALPGATFVAVSDMLDRLRMVQSEAELALTRSADAIADIGQQLLIDLLTPGKRAPELTAAVRTAMIDEILDRHPDMPFHLHVGCGLGAIDKGAGHSEWTTWNRDDRVARGQLLETIISVWLWGYWGNVERAVSVGEPTEAVRRAFEIMVEANEAAIAGVRPGISLAAIDRIPKDVFARYGYTTRTGSGCGRGITSYEADARELKMDLRPYADVICETGMAFSLEPDLEVPGIGTFRHCNTIIVTETGCEVDSQVPRGVIWI